jgi:hypothetical protein
MRILSWRSSFDSVFVYGWSGLANIRPSDLPSVEIFLLLLDSEVCLSIVFIRAKDRLLSNMK